MISRLFILISCFISLQAHSQLKAEQALQKLYERYPQERVYLLYNKEYFVAGETMYFKSYVFEGFALSQLSTNLYVELYDIKKNLVDQMLVPLVRGVGEGSFALKNNMAEGVYYVRAYTKPMLNFDPAFQYFFSIPVYNTASPEKLTIKPVQWAIAALPESGSLLEGRENKVSVRMFTNGFPQENWRGTVTETTGEKKTISTFTSYNGEVGIFTIRPE